MTAPIQEAWLRGPVPNIHALLQPVAHALIDAEDDVRKVVTGLTSAQLSSRPGGSGSVAFHVTHAMGSLDRLMTYARGESLNETQLAVLAAEKAVDETSRLAEELVAAFTAAVKTAHARLAATREEELLAIRLVGRKQLPSNTLGLLFHAAEHTARHVGQLVTTAKIVRATTA